MANKIKPIMTGTRVLINRTIQDQRNVIKKTLDAEQEEFTVYKPGTNNVKMELVRLMHEFATGLITIYVNKKPVATTHPDYKNANNIEDNDIWDTLVLITAEYNKREQAQNAVLPKADTKEEQEINTFLFQQLQNNR